MVRPCLVHYTSRKNQATNIKVFDEQKTAK